jgi:hypothetical protein
MQKCSGRVLAIISYFYDIYLFLLWQKCKNEIAHLEELHSIQKTAGKPGLLKKDDDRLHHCRIELMDLTLRHQLAMQRYKEVATPIRYSFASGSRKMQRDPMEMMRTYTITKCRDAHQ